MLVISTYTTLSATEDAPVKTEAVGLEHLGREESRMEQDPVKMPGVWLLESCPLLHLLNCFIFFSVVGAGSSPVPFGVVLWGRGGRGGAGCGAGDRARVSPPRGGSEPEDSSAVATCARAEWPNGAAPSALPPLPTAPTHPAQRYVNLRALPFFVFCFFFFRWRGYKFGFGWSSDKACDYASALFTGSRYLLFVYCAR